MWRCPAHPTRCGGGTSSGATSTRTAWESSTRWLRLARQIGQAGLPVVLDGMTIPEQIEPLGERRYFSSVHYLALVCDDAELEYPTKRTTEVNADTMTALAIAG